MHKKTLISCKLLNSFLHWHYFHKSQKPLIFWSCSGREQPSTTLYFHLFLFTFCPRLKKRGKFKPTEYFLRNQSFLHCLTLFLNQKSEDQCHTYKVHTILFQPGKFDMQRHLQNSSTQSNPIAIRHKIQ